MIDENWTKLHLSDPENYFYTDTKLADLRWFHGVLQQKNTRYYYEPRERFSQSGLWRNIATYAIFPHHKKVHTEDIWLDIPTVEK